MTALIAAIIAKLVPVLIGSVTGWVSAKLHTFMLKRQASADITKAVDNAAKYDDTSGLFDGHAK